MGIDGLILLDNTGRSVIQSGFRSTSAAYPFLHIEAFNAALANVQRPIDLDSVIYVPHPNNVEVPSACCHASVGDLRILCPISGSVDPLLGFAFLRTFVDILQEYFGDVSLVTVKENFDIVYQLLEEILDSVGHPLTTSHNALRDIVLPPSLLSKLLSAAGANLATIGGSGTGVGPMATGPFSSPIPWRRAGVKYASNEIYFDVVEDFRAIVNKHGVPLTSNIYGQIEGNCRLSGTPDCSLNFSNPQVLADCAFHPCIRLGRWSKDKSLSFIPPDGHFILAEYRYAPSPSANSALRLAPAGNTNNPSGKEVVPIPFAIKTTFEFEGSTASFNISFTSRLTTRPIENVSVELNLGDGVHGARCVASRESGGLGRGFNSLEISSTSSSASWAYDSKKKVLRWTIPNAPPSTHWTLQGSFTAATTPPRPSHALQIRFEIQSHTFSALKVDQLKISEAYNPYKGVRGRSSGNIEWRW